jgi:hypothetical protein
MTKGRDLSDAEDRGMVPGEQIYQMQRTEENLSDTEDRGMVPGGA